MDTINVQYFYGLGYALGRIQALSASNEQLDSPHWSSYLELARDWTKNCSTFELGVFPKTKKAAHVLMGVLDTFPPLLGQNRGASLDEYDKISDAIAAFYNVLEQEVEDTHCYIVTPVGAYAVTALLKDASSHLSKAAQAVVSDETREDFDKAGQCLALDLYTACGFHAMRAVEAEARFYHKDITGVELTDVPLGTLIYGDQKRYPGSGLHTQYAAEGTPHDSALGLIVSLLSQINAIYRRNIMHPEMALKAHTAKFVFDIAAIAISAMVTDILTRFKARKEAQDVVQSPTKD